MLYVPDRGPQSDACRLPALVLQELDGRLLDRLCAAFWPPAKRGEFELHWIVLEFIVSDLSPGGGARRPVMKREGPQPEREEGGRARRTLQLEILDPVGRVHMENTLVAQYASNYQLECLKGPSSLNAFQQRGTRATRRITFRLPSAPVSVLLSCFMYFTPSEKSCAGIVRQSGTQQAS